MAVHWRIPFTSLDNTQYEVLIYDDDYTGSTPITLVGAATPFVTQEDDDDDVFTPIRTQTGYIRIFDDGKDANGSLLGDGWWHSLIPVGALDRMVEVTKSSTVVWRGFIQPQSFSGEIYNGPQEREFPVCDRLTILKCWDVIPTDFQTTNFARLIYYIFTNVLSKMTTSFSFAGGASYVPDWLLKQVSWENFGERDNNNVLQPKYSCYEMLEEICKFFGWTCRCFEDEVYFDMAGWSTSWIHFTSANFLKLATGYTYSSYTYNANVKTALPGSFASTENTETYLQGWRKSTVVANVGKISTLIEYPSGGIFKYFKANSVTRTNPATGLYKFTKKDVFPLTLSMSFQDVDLTFFEGDKQQQGYGTISYYGAPRIYEYNNNQSPKTLNLKNVLTILRSPSNVDMLFSMTSKNHYWLNDGIIVISAKAYTDHIDSSANPATFSPYNAFGSLECMLKVGNKYWNGSNWVSTYSTFYVPTGTDGVLQRQNSEGKIKSDKIWNDGYPNFDGHKIPITSAVGGTVEFGIHAFEDGASPSSEAGMNECNLVDLKIEFLRNNTEQDADEDDENKYIVDGSRAFMNEKVINTIFTCDNNNQFGTGIIANPDGTYCQTLVFEDGTLSAGQHLANRMAVVGGKTRRMMVLETTGGDTSLYKPHYILNYGSVRYVPIAITHDWRDDVYTMKFIEIDN